MQRLSLYLPVIALITAGCTSTRTKGESVSASDATSSDAQGDVDDERKLDNLRRDLEVARARLDVARLQLEGFESQQGVEARHAQAEIDMAQAKEARFRELDAPNRLASATLDLTTARDRAQEAKDELAQIEIMYAEQDLDDLTAEFVVNRGRRSAARAAQRIEIQEGEFKSLEERELPLERQKHALEVDKASAKLEEIAREGEIGLREKTIAVRKAENEIAKIEGEIADLTQKIAE